MVDQTRKGVYFLANDAIYDWAVAFLESFRQYNPDLRLILIPFNDHSDRVRKLLPRYNVEALDHAAFPELERIGYSINRGKVSYGPHWFRRFAAFLGPLDEFFYIDGRTIVLTDLRKIIDARAASGFDLLHYDVSMDQVYLKGPFRDRLLLEKRPSGFMSGFFVSRKGAFTLEEMIRYGEQAQEVLQQLDNYNADQAFLNYICDVKGLKTGALYYWFPNWVNACWAWSNPGIYRVKDRYYRWDHGGLQHNRFVPLLHWAGIKRGPLMPYSHLHLKYRMRSEPAWKGLAMHAEWMAKYPPLKLVDALRRNRHINTIYHGLQHKFRGRDLPPQMLAVLKK